MEFNPHLELPFDEFFEKNEKLVHYITKRYKIRANQLNVDYEDIFSLACIGFFNAYKNYDPTKFEKVNSFSTYAVPTMEGEIRRYLRDKGHLIKYPRRIKEIGWKIKELEWEEKEPSELVELIPEYLSIHTIKSGVTLDCIADALSFLSNISLSSLNKTVSISTNGKELNLADTIGEEDSYDSLFLEDFASTLTDREREVLELRMRSLSQYEIGKELNVSQAHISRLLKRIQKKYYIFKSEEDSEMNYTLKDKEKAIHLLKETTKTYREISETTKIPFSTVAALGKEHRSEKDRKNNISVYASKRKGIPQAKKYEYNEAQVIALVEEGKMSYVEISKLTGAPTGSISKIVKNAKRKEQKMNDAGPAPQPSINKIQRRKSSESYDIYGKDVPSTDLINELEVLLNKLKNHSEDKVSFSLSIQTNLVTQGAF